MINTYHAGISVAASGVLLPAVAGKRIMVHAFAAISTVATNAKLQSNGVDITGNFPLAANGGFVLPWSEAGWAVGEVGQALSIVLSVATNTGIQLNYSYV